MTITVWMDGWQMECCGEPFAIGQEVSWDVQQSDRDRLEKMLGAELARGIEWAEDHHGPIIEDEMPLTGIVVSIRTVRQRYKPVPGRGARDLYPVAGSATVTNIRSTDRHERELDGQQFVGYIVELDETPLPPF